MLNHTSVSVLGGGIAGSIAACLLKDAGQDVAIVDREGDVMAGASRWNEGKVHLGFTYTGTSDLSTARLMLQGASEFESVLERVTGEPIPSEWWTEPVVYLVDEHSIFPPEVLWERARATACLIGDMAKACVSLRKHIRDEPLLVRLTPENAMATTAQSGVVAAWRTAERAVSPRPVAKAVRDAVRARDIPVIRGQVHSVSADQHCWQIALDNGPTLKSRTVINALWESRPRFDQMAGAAPESCVIRYKLGIFATRAKGWTEIAPSTRIIGKFGDITPYGDGDLYLSWYPAGFLARSDDSTVPAVPSFDELEIRNRIMAGLGLSDALARSVGSEYVLRGGYVVANGAGDISEIDSSLHARKDPDAREIAPGFISVDTGKYTLGPMLGQRAADLVLRRSRL